MSRQRIQSFLSMQSSPRQFKTRTYGSRLPNRVDKVVRIPSIPQDTFTVAPKLDCTNVKRDALPTSDRLTVIHCENTLTSSERPQASDTWP